MLREEGLVGGVTEARAEELRVYKLSGEDVVGKGWKVFEAECRGYPRAGGTDVGCNVT